MFQNQPLAMSQVLSTGKTDKDPNQLDFRYEFARKAIHLSSLLIPLIYCRINRDLALMILTPLTAGFLIVDILKNFVPAVADWYHGTFAPMLRHHELQKDHIHLNGATWITLSAFILIALFPKMIAVTAFAMVSVSDTVAALVGKKFGRHRFSEKSVEGSLAFLFSAVAIAMIVPKVLLPAGIAMAVAGTVAEALVLRVGGFKIDDNITVPLASALAGLACYIWFFPGSMDALSSCR
jgi:dolichol kinase